MAGRHLTRTTVDKSLRIRVGVHYTRHRARAYARSSTLLCRVSARRGREATLACCGPAHFRLAHQVPRYMLSRMCSASLSTSVGDVRSDMTRAFDARTLALESTRLRIFRSFVCRPASRDEMSASGVTQGVLLPSWVIMIPSFTRDLDHLIGHDTRDRAAGIDRYGCCSGVCGSEFKARAI